MKRNKIIAIAILVAVIIIGVILAVVFGSAKSRQIRLQQHLNRQQLLKQLQQIQMQAR